MMKAPPLLPEETLRRLLRVARFDGLCVLALPGLFALLSAGVGDTFGALVGLLVAAAGAVELHGADLLRAGEPRGQGWLIISQLYLMAVIVGFCAWQLTHVDLTLWRMAVTPEVRASLVQLGMTEDEFLAATYRIGYRLIAFITIVYQGALAFYYLRRRDAVYRALGAGA
jgi:hypothetical protein